MSATESVTELLFERKEERKVAPPEKALVCSISRNTGEQTRAFLRKGGVTMNRKKFWRVASIALMVLGLIGIIVAAVMLAITIPVGAEPYLYGINW